MCLNHKHATRSHREAYFAIAHAYIFKDVCKQPMGEHAQVIISRGHQKNCAVNELTEGGCQLMHGGLILNLLFTVSHASKQQVGLT